MEAATDGRIRLTVLGGYLGSGKTTWLRHQLHEGLFKDAFVIVNEAAETPVDDALLQQSSRLAVLAGGCACCSGKADLVKLLQSLCNERSKTVSTDQRLEHIVLETSGLADPGLIVEAIKGDPILVNHIVVSEIIVMIDGLHALSQLRTEPLGRRQAEIADRFMISKLDETETADTAKLLATLRILNPGAALFGSVQGTHAALPDFDGVEAEGLAELADLPHRQQIFPAKIKIDDNIDWTAFSIWLSALLHARGENVVRVKGVVRTPAGRLLIQTVRKIVQSPEILPEQDDRPDREDGTIVVIGRGYEAEDLTRSLHRFAGVISANL